MTPLQDIIADEIQNTGAITFARFMEIALYCPVCGYYEKEKDIGKSGDFFTNVSVGSVFGELISKQFSDWLEEIDNNGTKPASSSVIVEAGAHDGVLARDILTWLCNHRRALFERVTYHIVEPSATRQQRQRSMLDSLGEKVSWVESLKGLAGASGETGLCGIMFSNELLDSFPIHLIEWNARERAWFERGVTLRKNQLDWTAMKLPECLTATLHFHEKLEQVLPDKFCVEVCPAAKEWWTQAAQSLRRGKLMTIDYGFTAEEQIAPERTRGTLRAYSRHHVTADVLANPGEQDITADVNFSAIQSAGEAAGLKTEGLIFQEQFLNRIAGRTWNQGATMMHWTPARLRQFQTLTHPEHLGRKFRVLIQSR